MPMGYKKKRKKQISGRLSDLVYQVNWAGCWESLRPYIIHNHKSWRERSLIPEILCLSLRLTIFLQSFFKPKEKLLKLNVIHSFPFLSLTVLIVHVYAWISLLYIHNDSLSRTVNLIQSSMFYLKDLYFSMIIIRACHTMANVIR